ncbi:hypothetical protein A9R01_14015 ['Osedax' symbiont bacterium Rs2_46_30_T18]|nr:hypothetical protein A9R01_14015 ['Osedax' symbiont bacterium Rs2_46_30_T18]
MDNNTPQARFSYSLFIAVAIHAMAILAIGFSWAGTSVKAESIEVTLAQYQATESNQDADYFAQIDQLGSGDAEQKQQLSSERISVQQQGDQQAQQQLSSKTTPSEHQQPLEVDNSVDLERPNSTANFDVVVSSQADHKKFLKQFNPSLEPIAENLAENTIDQQIMALKTQINTRREAIAKAPRKRVISTMSTKSHQDAAYLENWRRRIVTIGNSHYPKAANEQKIYGRVRLLVAMRADGNVNSIEILESSGRQILDHGAVKIIRLAAPFQPFSTQMRKSTDILEIIRTIEFEKTTLIY